MLVKYINVVGKKEVFKFNIILCNSVAGFENYNFFQRAKKAYPKIRFL